MSNNDTDAPERIAIHASAAHAVHAKWGVNAAIKTKKTLADDVAYIRADIHDATLKREAALRKASQRLEHACRKYRRAHDAEGGDSRNAGYWRDKMRQAGSDVDDALAQTDDDAAAGPIKVPGSLQGMPISDRLANELAITHPEAVAWRMPDTHANDASGEATP